MLPKNHLFLGIGFVAILYFFFYPVISLFGLTIILLSSVLIDVDHYFYYVFKKKDFNLFNAYRWYKKNVRKLYSLKKEQRKTIYFGFYLFHNIECLIILFFLGKYISLFFTLILIGVIFHLFLDFISEIVYEQRFDKISFIYNLFSFRKLVHIDDFDSMKHS